MAFWRELFGAPQFEEKISKCLKLKCQGFQIYNILNHAILVRPLYLYHALGCVSINANIYKPKFQFHI